MLTDRDIAVVCALARYYVLNRVQIQHLCFPDDQSGRITRRRLQALVDERLINRLRVLVQHPHSGSPGPVYFPSQKGCEFLAEHFDDERYLAGASQPPLPHHVLHWLAVSDTHIVLDQAIASQKRVQLAAWFNEWDIVNAHESLPDKRFRLYMLLRESPRLVCAPDGGFLLSVADHRKVFYLEQDRNTSGVRQIAASKTQGYAVMAAEQLHRRHFPDTTANSFSVLMIAPTASRRDALRKAIADKPGANLWKFAAVTDLTPQTFLSAPVFYPVQGEPAPLVRPEATSEPLSSTEDHNNTAN